MFLNLFKDAYNYFICFYLTCSSSSAFLISLDGTSCCSNYKHKNYHRFFIYSYSPHIHTTAPYLVQQNLNLCSKPSNPGLLEEPNIVHKCMSLSSSRFLYYRLLTVLSSVFIMWLSNVPVSAQLSPLSEIHSLNTHA